MDQSTLSVNKRVIILTNVVLTPHEQDSYDGNLAEPEVVDLTCNDIEDDEENSSSSKEPQLFKNLFVSFPTRDVQSNKRKRDDSIAEQSKTEKAAKADIESDDDEAVVFNYMTGTYEPVKKCAKLGPDQNNINPKNQPEEILIEKQCLGTEELTAKGGTQQSHMSQKNISPNVLENNPVLNLSHPPSPSNIYPSIPAKSAFVESHSHVGNEYKHSVNSVSASSPILIDDSSNDTIVNTDSYLNLENVSSSVSGSGRLALKSLFVRINRLPISLINSYNNLETERDQEHNSPDGTGLSSNVGKGDVANSKQGSRSEKYFVKKLKDTKQAQINWDCKTCGFKAKTKTHLISHIYRMHLKDEYEMIINCKSCSFECDTQNEMENHKLTHVISLAEDADALSSIEISDDADALSSIEISDDDVSRTTYFQCFLCNFRTNKKLNVKYHAGKHHKDKYFCPDHFWTGTDSTCPKCIFENMMSNLYKSLITCKNCGYSTTRAFYLKLHVSRSFSCQQYIAREANKNKTIDTSSDFEKNNSERNQSVISSIEPIPNRETSQSDAATNMETIESEEQISVQKSVEDNVSSSSSTVPETILSKLGRVATCDKDNKNGNKQACKGTSNLSLQNEEAFSKDMVDGNSLNSFNICDDLIYVAEDIEISDPATNAAENVRTSVSGNNNFRKRNNLEMSECEENSNEPVENDVAIIFKCFDCNSSISELYGLKMHALACHPDSLFKCDVHDFKVNFHECGKCVYELIFKTCTTTHEDPFYVDSRRIFNSEVHVSKGKRIFQNVHKRSVKKLRSHQADYSTTDSDFDSDIEQTEGPITRSHAGKNKDRTDETLKNSGNDDLNSDSDFDGSVAKTRRVKIVQKLKANDKCDCNYSKVFTQLYTFKCHVCRHLGSKYQCTEHWQNKSEDCIKCRYEILLQCLENEVECCKTCQYKTSEKMHFSRHVNSKFLCKKGTQTRKLSPGEILCYDCRYITRHKDNLKYHAVDHLDTEFSCKHHNKIHNKCLECIYAECLANAKKEVLICETCQFKTVIKDVFAVHRCREELTAGSHELHNVEQRVSSDATLQKKTTTKYKCFDCDGFTSDANDKQKIHTWLCAYQKEVRFSKNDNNGGMLVANSEIIVNAPGNNEPLLDKHGSETNSETVNTGNIEGVSDHQENVQISLECKKNEMDVSNNEILVETQVISNNQDNVDISLEINENEMEVSNSETLVQEFVSRKATTGNLEPVLDNHEDDHVSNTTVLDDLHTEGVVDDVRREINTENIDPMLDNQEVIREVFDVHNCTQEIISENDSVNSKTSTIGIDNQNVSKSSSKKASKTQLGVKCFDCKSFFSRNDFTFKEHVRCHIGSKYQCTEHWKSKVTNCLKCHYEKLLEKLQKEVKCCNICSYKALDESNLTRHLNEFGACGKWVNRKLQPNEIRCCKCQYITVSKKFLKYHMVDHLDMTCSCSTHKDNKSETCEQCINEECLKNAKNEVKTCEKCNFKTVIKQIFNLHECEETVRKTGRLKTTQIENIVGIANNQNVHKKIQEKKKIVQCFDCKFSPKYATTSGLRRHIIFHIGSKFQCLDHYDIKYRDCPKCHYEITLKTASKNVKFCNNCKYRTVDNYSYALHKRSTTSCNQVAKERLLKDGIICLKCHYTTFNRKFLTYHMVDHLDVTFSCRAHKNKKRETCVKCINEECLEEAKNKVRACETCGFKTVIKQIFEIHDCQQEMTTNCEGNEQDAEEPYQTKL